MANAYVIASSSLPLPRKKNSHSTYKMENHLLCSNSKSSKRGFEVLSLLHIKGFITPRAHAQQGSSNRTGHVTICDRLWENGAFGAENKNVDFNLF